MSSINESCLSYVQQPYKRSRSLTIDTIDLFRTFALSTAVSSSSYRTIPLPDSTPPTRYIAAGAAAIRGILLGEFGAVMVAEVLGISVAWEEGYSVVASDSQAAMRRCRPHLRAAERKATDR